MVILYLVIFAMLPNHFLHKAKESIIAHSVMTFWHSIESLAVLLPSTFVYFFDFLCTVTYADFISKVRSLRNELAHSCTLRITEEDYRSNLDLMLLILESEVCLKENVAAKRAARNIRYVSKHFFVISFNICWKIGSSRMIRVYSLFL